MSFVTKEWKDRLAEFAGRRKLTNVSTGEETTVDVSRAEGEVSQAGDAFSAANMNDLEQRIKDGFDKVDTNLYELDSKSKIRVNALEKQGGIYTFNSNGILYILCAATGDTSSFFYADSALFGSNYISVAAPYNTGQRSMQYHINKGDTITVTLFQKGDFNEAWFAPYK